MDHPYRDQFRLNAKVAIVTGGSRGIGLAIAEGLAEFGAAVVLAGRKADAVEAAAAELRAQGREAIGVAAHLGQADDIQRLVAQTVECYGGVDVVVNNAATNPALGPLESVDESVFDKIMGVNLKGPWLLTKAALSSLRRRGGGSIINVASVAGIRPEPQLGAYSVSKAGLIGLTKALALELAADKIRVNALCPGLVRTRFSSALWQNSATLETFLKRVPAGRMAEAEEIVPLAVYLAADASAYCTGGVWVVDGGQTV